MKQFIKLAERWLIAILVIATSFWMMLPVYRLGFEKFQGDNTVTAFTQWVKIGGLAGFFLIVWAFRNSGTRQKILPNTEKSIASGKIVLVCACVVLTGIAAINMLVDPWDLYGTNFFESRVLSDRADKLKYYSRLTESPEMVIVGSSAAFEISPAYIEEKLGIRAFNWSMSAGKAEEIEVLLKYLANQDGGEYPRIVLMQLVESPPLKNPYSLVPIPLFPYLDFWSMIKETSLRVSQAFDLSQFSDAIYVVRYRLSPNTKSFTNMYFLEDGYGTRIQKNFSETEVLKQSTKIPDCNSIDEIFQADIQDMVAFAKERNTSLIFYVSPILPDFYNAYMRDDPGYQRCHQIVTEYFTGLTQDHENVFFRDYLLLESMDGLGGQEGFYDGAHLTRQNADRLIDALSTTILQADAVAEDQRRAEGGGSE